jgi:hydrogenase maturation protein HypF
MWGGELLTGDTAGFERAGHLWPLTLPGGEQAIRHPWRMDCPWLQQGLEDLPPSLPGVDPQRWEAVAALARRGGPAASQTTSMGRLFDAVAALCGIRLQLNYEGQAAVAVARGA